MVTISRVGGDPQLIQHVGGVVVEFFQLEFRTKFSPTPPARP